MRIRRAVIVPGFQSSSITRASDVTITLGIERRGRDKDLPALQITLGSESTTVWLTDATEAMEQLAAWAKDLPTGHDANNQ